MRTPLPEVIVQPDAFRVAGESLLLSAELRGAVAVCVHDDTQGAGGLLHLRYVATNGDAPLDLTDNTLSSDLLLMDRFCKELRQLGARKQSWRVNVIGHSPDAPEMDAPAATVIDLIKAYFADSRHPVRCRQFRRSTGLVIRLEAREGRLFMGGADAQAPSPTMSPRLTA